MSDIDTPQFDLPLRIDAEGRDFIFTEQDSLEEVADCVESLVRTPLGFYEEEPDYGITDPTFTEGRVDIDEIQSAITEWEDRADVMIEENPDLLDHFVSRVTLNTRVRSDG